MRDTSFVVVPIREHAFFEQSQLQSLFSHDLFQITGFPTKVFDFSRGRRTRRVARQTLLPCFQELLRPAGIEALGNTLSTAQLGNAVLALQAVQNDPDLLFGRILFARRAANVLYDLLTVALSCSGFLSHLHSLVVTMCQKPSLIKST